MDYPYTPEQVISLANDLTAWALEKAKKALEMKKRVESALCVCSRNGETLEPINNLNLDAKIKEWVDGLAAEEYESLYKEIAKVLELAKQTPSKYEMSEEVRETLKKANTPRVPLHPILEGNAKCVICGRGMWKNPNTGEKAVCRSAICHREKRKHDSAVAGAKIITTLLKGENVAA